MHDCPESLQTDRRSVDRRCRHDYVFRDKRTGFDRRKPRAGTVVRSAHDMLIALRDKPGVLGVILVVVNALNLIDFGLTLHALSIGAAEANPVMAGLFEIGPVWAGIFKTAAILVATAIVWECRRYRKALIAAVAMLLVFAAIFIYHIVGLTFLC